MIFFPSLDPGRTHMATIDCRHLGIWQRIRNHYYPASLTWVEFPLPPVSLGDFQTQHLLNRFADLAIGYRVPYVPELCSQDLQREKDGYTNIVCYIQARRCWYIENSKFQRLTEMILQEPHRRCVGVQSVSFAGTASIEHTDTW